MKKTTIIFIYLLTVCLELFAQQPQKLWYKKPAKVWTEALPIGNGRLGAMIYGGAAEELIQLNESTLWTGGSNRTTCPQSGFI